MSQAETSLARVNPRIEPVRPRTIAISGSAAVNDGVAPSADGLAVGHAPGGRRLEEELRPLRRVDPVVDAGAFLAEVGAAAVGDARRPTPPADRPAGRAARRVPARGRPRRASRSGRHSRPQPPTAGPRSPAPRTPREGRGSWRSRRGPTGEGGRGRPGEGRGGRGRRLHGPGGGAWAPILWPARAGRKAPVCRAGAASASLPSPMPVLASPRSSRCATPPPAPTTPRSPPRAPATRRG